MFIEISFHGKRNVENRLGVPEKSAYWHIYQAWESRDPLPQWARKKQENTERQFGKDWVACRMFKGNLYIFHYRPSVSATGKTPRFLTLLSEEEEKNRNPHNFDKFGRPKT